jgi:hypothetical protein
VEDDEGLRLRAHDRQHDPLQQAHGGFGPAPERTRQDQGASSTPPSAPCVPFSHPLPHAAPPPFLALSLWCVRCACASGSSSRSW